MIDTYFKAWTNTLLATQVVTARLPILYMLALDPTPSRQREAERMIAEKQEALIDGLAGVMVIAARSWPDMITRRPAADNGLSLLNAYLKALYGPAERILQDNATRLGRCAA